MWVRTGRPAAAEVRSTSCRAADTLPEKLSRMSSGWPPPSGFSGLAKAGGTLDPDTGKKLFQFALQSSELRISGSRLQMNDDVHPRQRPAARPAPEDLADPPLQALTNHGLAHLAARRNPEPRRPLFVGMEVKRRQRAVTPCSPAVATQILGATPQLVAPAKPLGRNQPFHRQALSRLRPLRRRLANTARPLRVFIRARKP